VPKVFRERMQDGYAGYTDGFDVFLDDRLNAEQTLCTLQQACRRLMGSMRNAQSMAVRAACVDPDVDHGQRHQIHAPDEFGDEAVDG